MCAMLFKWKGGWRHFSQIIDAQVHGDLFVSVSASGKESHRAFRFLTEISDPVKKSCINGCG